MNTSSPALRSKPATKQVILIADDNAFWVKLHQEYLRERFPDSEILTCNSYQSAKKIVTERGKDLTLVVSDFDMRDKRIDGVLLSRHLQKSTGKEGAPKFIMFSTSIFMKPTVAMLGTNNITCFRKASIDNPAACKEMLDKAFQGIN